MKSIGLGLIGCKLGTKWGEWPGGIGVTLKKGRIPVQTSLGAQPGFGAQPCHETPSDPRLEQE